MGTPRAIDTEFSELLATAIENSEVREAVRRLAEEQAALRRVATLVAENPESEELFSAVAREVARVLDVRGVIVDQFEADGSQVTLGSAYDLELASAEAFIGVGARMPLQPGKLAALVQETRRAARVEDYSKLDAEMGAAARAAGIGSGCGAPIFVDGELWGQLCVFSARGTPLPADTEDRLDDFAKLVATAISNHEARVSLRMLADEQGGLRRVATLVARGTASPEIFDAVCLEAGKLLGARLVGLFEYTGNGLGVVLAGSWRMPGEILPRGAGFAVAADTVCGLIRETGQPARIDSYENASSELAARVGQIGLRSSVGAPVMVDGKLWGALVAGTDEDEPLPAGAEFRLAHFTDLIATAVSNAATRAQLIASRARLVAAGDDARRRIERNLHDGTQQQLIALGLDLQAVRATVPTELAAAHEGFDRIEEGLEAVLEDVRELSRGLHPALLTRGGLPTALRALARKSPIPIELSIDVDERPPQPIETAIYFVVSEAVTNAIKHSRATRVSVRILRSESVVEAAVEDDGIGGAAFDDGSGLTGLVDRVEALGGRLALQSPAGSGTRVSIELPLVLQGDGDALTVRP